MSDSSSGGITAVVAIVAIIVILGVGFFVFQSYQGNAGPSIDVNLPTPTGQQ